MPMMKSKLRLIGALSIVALLAIAVACKGFFPGATLQTVSLQPPNPSVQVGQTTAVQAWGTDTNNNRYQLTSGVSWSLSNPSSGTVATIDQKGNLTGQNSGTITITASSQGISATATATVFQVITAMTITPASGASVTDDGTSYQAFTIKDQNGNNISSLVTLIPQQNGTTVTGIDCAYQLAATDGMQDCRPQAGLVPTGTSQTYDIVVSYSGYTGPQVSATLLVNGP